MRSSCIGHFATSCLRPDCITSLALHSIHDDSLQMHQPDLWTGCCRSHLCSQSCEKVIWLDSWRLSPAPHQRLHRIFTGCSMRCVNRLTVYLLWSRLDSPGIIDRDSSQASRQNPLLLASFKGQPRQTCTTSTAPVIIACDQACLRVPFCTRVPV